MRYKQAERNIGRHLCCHACDDPAQCFVPRGAPEVVGAPIADQRMQKARRIFDHLPRSPSPDAEESLTVRVGLKSAWP